MPTPTAITLPVIREVKADETGLVAGNGEDIAGGLNTTGAVGSVTFDQETRSTCLPWIRLSTMVTRSPGLVQTACGGLHQRLGRGAEHVVANCSLQSP